MKPQLVFAHGWGFDRSVWRGVVERLGGYDCVLADLGYFGDPLPFSQDLNHPVVIGHSFGAMWLLEEFAASPASLAGFVAINGFPRFTTAPDYAPAVGSRIVERMIVQFKRDPESVLRKFRARSGAPIELHRALHLNVSKLQNGLEALARGDLRPVSRRLQCPILSLAAKDDQIVPPAMSEHGFDDARVERHWHETAGHALPLNDPAWCVSHILAFIKGIEANS